jgi:DNA-binding LacI/PurR family transcriptional regulator
MTAKTTLKEIAERTGVSVSTVSRIINSPDDTFARKPIRDKVWEIVRETGYTPNQSARALKRSTESPAKKPLTVTCILGRTRNFEDNPFFAQVARSVEQQALSMGCSVSKPYSVLDVSERLLLKEAGFVKADGAIVLGRFKAGMRNFFENHYKNIVYVGRNVIDADWDQVVCDGYEAGKTALRYLMELGHRRIGYIGETKDEVRYRAYADAVKECGLDDDRALVASFPQDSAGGYRGAGYLLRASVPRPTAVFCATDISAVAAIKRFSEAGIRIPEQLSVIGMDDIEIAQYVTPMLTTVSIPKVELGKVALHTLLDRINGVHRLPIKIFLPHKLLIRESTAKPKVSE